MITEVKFTPTETRLLRMLSDGNRHLKTELMTCIEDDLANPMTVNYHLCNIRKKLRDRGEGIIVELWERRIYYRQVRFLPSSNQ